jgi:SAM-dependent methyltransferase
MTASRLAAEREPEADSATPHACPLCAGGMAVVDERYEGREVLELWARNGREFSSEVRAEFERFTPTVLSICDHCGFGLFDPLWEVSSGFYDELQADWSEYYLANKWEYEQALAHLRSGDRVLDVGCGAGFFLELVRGAGGVAVGVEPSARARGSALARGLDVRDVDIVAAGDELDSGFDLVSAFQVLEHVRDPVGFATALRERLRPGGALVIAVPNAQGSLRWVRDAPSEIPPHHLTRWSPSSIDALALALGLDLQHVALQPLERLHFGHLEHAWTNGVLRGWGAGRPRHSLSGFVRRISQRGVGVGVRAARRCGLQTLPMVHGHTLVATLRARVPARTP